jgi:hypothetical protein
MSLTLSANLAADLAELYRDMESAYDRVAEQLHHNCDGCPDNCCDSYFTHHTYIEWAYLWLGLAELNEERRQQVSVRAARCIDSYAQAREYGKRPQIMCPLNENGRCSLYRYRLMVCRTHGVPAVMTRPDGRVIRFPGCFRCQEQIETRPGQHPLPLMERTLLLRRLVDLEQRFVGGRRTGAPRLAMTIAGMVVDGPPTHA